MTAQPSTAAREDVRARAIEADSVLVPIDPMTKSLLEKKPALSSEPKKIEIVTYRGSSDTRSGNVCITLQLDPVALQPEHFDQELIDQSHGAFSYFDLRFMLAYQALWEKAEKMNIPIEKRYFSVAQICKHMTASKRPATAQMQRVMAAAYKLMHLKVQIDARCEAHLRNHSRSCRGSVFLPASVEQGTMNGSMTELIHPQAEAPLFAFAKERRQFTTVPANVFRDSPLSLTEGNVNIEYYLLSRIREINHSDNGELVIKIETFLRECGIIPPAEESAAAAARFRQQKRRALINAEKWLAHLQEQGLIEDSSKEKDRFCITLKPRKRKRKTKTS